MGLARRLLVFVTGTVPALLALGILVPRPLFSADDGQMKDLEILVISNPIHTDIAIPANHDVLKKFGFLGQSGLPVDSPQLKWLVFGWGGRAFYLETPTWSELKWRPALKALTIDKSVIRVELYGEIRRDLSNVKSFKLSKGHFDKAVQDIADSFSEAVPRAIDHPGYGPVDRFYEAKGYFNFLIGCNTWTAAILRDAGLRTGMWNPFPKSLLTSLEIYN